jgi:hypothetical protein
MDILQVKEKCGVLIKSSDYGILWVIAPFWDTSEPIIIQPPGQKLDAIIILNHVREGCLPLSSIYGLNAPAESGKLYVTDIEMPYDYPVSFVNPCSSILMLVWT